MYAIVDRHVKLILT